MSSKVVRLIERSGEHVRLLFARAKRVGDGKKKIHGNPLFHINLFPYKKKIYIYI